MNNDNFSECFILRNDPESDQGGEQRRNLFSKIVLITALSLALGATATLTYRTISSQENNEFNAQFANCASALISASRENVGSSFSLLEIYSKTITSYAIDTKKTWPNVAVPHFEARMSGIAEQISALKIAFAPVVYDADRLYFEQSSHSNLLASYEELVDYLPEGKDLTAESLLNSTPRYITELKNTTAVRDETTAEIRLPILQITPYWETMSNVMNNLLTDPMKADAFFTMTATKTAAITFMNITAQNGKIESQVFQPIFDKVHGSTEDKTIVGVLWVVIQWANYFSNILSDNAQGVFVVVKSSCDSNAVTTFKINGLFVESLGKGDLHDTKYDNLEVVSDFINLKGDIDVPQGLCVPTFSLHIYPSDALRDQFTTNKGLMSTVAMISVILFVAVVFGVYDYCVRERQWKMIAKVTKQDKTVSNSIPSVIKDRLFGSDEGNQGFVPSDVNLLGSQPVADLFPSATVIFANIVGFTAWSSQREPPQVFMLLENIYIEFDNIAATSHGVFKIETVGDCYVAVSGLPEPQQDHAFIMAKFARDCMCKAKETTNKLEVTLGPDTADLGMRMGLNSGQVTAGVLRGERSRFQLFGETVNTAARMENTSSMSKIQVSDSTAKLLKKYGKGKWIKPRNETVSVKGKGEMQTYWLATKVAKRQGSKCGPSSLEIAPIVEQEETETGTAGEEHEEFGKEDNLTKTERLVQWNVDVLSKLLQQVVAARCDSKKKKLKKKLNQMEKEIGKGSTVLEEFKEIITLPKVNLADLKGRRDPNSIQLDPSVLSQLNDYITNISSSYRDNSFHNFEHASHVTASVRKLLSRIVSFDDNNLANNKNPSDVDLGNLIGHSYGITSDPLTQFSVVFSAVIHDVDHQGVPNTQLVKENIPIASMYKKKSVAEQNSVDLAWDLLMSPQYDALRSCIYSNEDELQRFRQLVVNTVMATDICDKELQALRKGRWAKAFSKTPVDSTPEDDVNRKATIVIEYLIQASDVSHTMQHWQIYKQWNQRFFIECYSAYREGRADSDPSIGWYKGEIGFFDFYIIPLAKKLKNCGVFGVSSDEYLNYAELNREQWAREGKNIVKDYLEQYELFHKSNQSLDNLAAINE